MKCNRCGHCCINYSVMIVDDPKKGIREDNIIHHEGKGPCKHLRGSKPGKYSCSIHKFSWYKKTPCFQYGQIEQKKTDVCRMGKYILSKVG